MKLPLHSSIARRPRRVISLVVRHVHTRRYLICSILIVLTTLPFLLQYILAYTIAKDPRILPSALREVKNVLFVTAYPGEESLYFAPSMLGILRPNEVNPTARQGGLLVLSSGNYYDGLGEKRKREVKGSCVILGIAEERCVVLEKEDLKDAGVQWDAKVIERAVEEYVKKWNVDTVITFDEDGTTHINHRYVSTAIKTFAAAYPPGLTAYTLTSTCAIRKYSFIFDLPLSSLSYVWRITLALLFRSEAHNASYGDKALIVNTWHSYKMTRRAVANQRSKYSRDRSLYLLLSRYVWFNELRRV